MCLGLVNFCITFCRIDAESCWGIFGGFFKTVRRGIDDALEQAHRSAREFYIAPIAGVAGQEFVTRLDVVFQSDPFDRASMEQRADVERLNASLKEQLIGKGLTFESPDRAGFRTALSSAGFYKEWREKFGAESWAVLESIVGKLS